MVGGEMLGDERLRRHSMSMALHTGKAVRSSVLSVFIYIRASQADSIFIHGLVSSTALIQAHEKRLTSG